MQSCIVVPLLAGYLNYQGRVLALKVGYVAELSGNGSVPESLREILIAEPLESNIVGHSEFRW